MVKANGDSYATRFVANDTLQCLYTGVQRIARRDIIIVRAEGSLSPTQRIKTFLDACQRCVKFSLRVFVYWTFSYKSTIANIQINTKNKAKKNELYTQLGQ